MAETPHKEAYEVIFIDPRLGMTVAGRFAVRAVSLITYLVLAATIVSLLFSDLLGLYYLSILGALFFMDRFLHLREADKPLSELPGSGTVNAARYMSPRAYSVLEHAYDRAAFTRRHFFLEAAAQLVGRPEVKEALRRLDVRPEEFSQKLDEFLTQSGKISATRQVRDEQVSELAIAAFHEAVGNSHEFVAVSDLVAALPRVGDEWTNRLFGVFNIEPDDVGQAVLFSSARRDVQTIRKKPVELSGFALEMHRGLRHRVMNRAWTSRPTPILDQFSMDLTDLARRGEIGFLVGHKEEYERLETALARSSNPNALLVGEAGSGRDAIISHLALMLSKDKVPRPLFDKRLVSLQVGSLVAGAEPQELQKRLERVIREINIAGNVILSIPDIHNLFKTSGAAYLSAADALMPIITNNLFPVIGTTYPRDFKEFLEPRSDFVGLFEVVRVNEIREEEAKRILVYQALVLEHRSKVVISFGAIKKAVELAKKYFRDKLLPRSAMDLLKNALAKAEERDESFLGIDQVVKTAEAEVNIPMHEAGEAEAEKLLNLEEIIHGRMVNQTEAVKAVADSLREYRSGLTRRGGPIASFLFVGPTGVGKTELAKTIARIQFGSEDLMIRFDMTEYQDKTSFFRFIGSPDGKTLGALTDAVIQKPYSVVLLDEFEKAFPDILNLFLQVLDDGRLTDNLGRTVDFANTLIIATSNAHSDIINDSLREGKSMMQIADYLKSRLTDVFKPELVNRFSKVVIFRNLEGPELSKIAEINLKDLAAIAAEQGITLSFDPSALGEVVRLGYDPTFGARPLRRVIDEQLRSPLASKILAKEVKKGDRATVMFENGAFKFRVLP